MTRSRRRWVVIWGALWLASCVPAVAAEPESNAGASAPASRAQPGAADPRVEEPSKPPAGQDHKPDSPTGKPDAPGGTSDEPFREQTIYIPYAKLREAFEKDGRGVFIPYERFQQLWEAAREHERRPPEFKPPQGAVITEADSEAVVGKDVVRVTATLKIDLLARGWVEVPLRLADAGVLAANLFTDQGASEPARLAVDERGSHKLLVENTSDGARSVTLKLEYAKAFSKSPGRNEVSFAAPQAPVNRWKARIPERGVKAQLEPFIAASEPQPKPGEPGAPAGDEAGETSLVAFVGPAPQVRLSWTARSEGASGLAALASVEAQTVLRVEEAVRRTHARLSYTISRAELPGLTLEVPGDQKVVNVSGTNVRQWSVEKTGPTQKIVVKLFEPARRAETVDVDLDQYGGDERAAAGAPAPKPGDPNARPWAIDAPLVRALDVARQSGVVVVDVADGLQAEPSRNEGLSQLDQTDLPAELAGAKHDFAYRYAAAPFTLSFDVTRVRPRVLVDELVETYLEPDRVTVRLQAAYTIERAGVFELALEVPAGFLVRDVRGEAIGGAPAAQVGSHHLEGENKTRLIVSLARKAIGRAGLFVELQRELDDPNLLAPTGKSSDLAAPAPRTAPDSVERDTGRLVVFASEALRVNPGKQSGVRSVSLSEAGDVPPSTGAPGGVRRALAFVYGKAPVELTLLVERRKPYVSVGQMLTAAVEPGVVKYQATFFYDIRYSAVKSLRIDVPAELAPELRIVTPGVTEHSIAPPPTDLAPGSIAWSLSGEGEFIGSAPIALAWESRLGNVEVGKSVTFAVPRLRPRDVDRSWGQIALRKSETIDVDPAGAGTGLRSIDPEHDLMPGADASDAALAFEFQDDWSLNVAATRYQLEAVKHTSIERGLVRAVFTRGGQQAVQALFRVRSARQRLAIGLPEGVEFDAEPLRINGAPAKLENGTKGEFFVPLAGRPDTSFLLEVRYSQPDATTRVEIPAFPDDPAAQKVVISAFLPQDVALLGTVGPWTDENAVAGGWFTGQQAPGGSDEALVAWVCEGTPLVGGNPGSSFPVDGRSHQFSTLRPEPSQRGALRLVTMRDKWLDGLVFAGVFALGLGLLRRTAAERVAAMALALIALVLAGVFLPTFSTLVIGGAFWLAAALVALFWIVWFFYQWTPLALRPGPQAPAAASLSEATATAGDALVETGRTGNEPLEPAGPDAAGEPEAARGETSDESGDSGQTTRPDDAPPSGGEPHA